MSAFALTLLSFLRHKPTRHRIFSEVDAATDSDDGDGDDNTSLDSGYGAGSGLPSAAAEEAALVERVKQATGCWPVITTTKSPPGDQAAGGADGLVEGCSGIE